jgi:hypothetical protein
MALHFIKAILSLPLRFDPYFLITFRVDLSLNLAAKSLAQEVFNMNSRVLASLL